MSENVVGILFLIIGSMIVSIVWLFVEMREYKRRLENTEVEQRSVDRAVTEQWRGIERCEERIAKMDVTIHESMIHNGPEVSGDDAE